MSDNTLKILFAEYVNTHPTGGSLHIAFEDGNLSDSDIAFCYRHAENDGDIAGMVIAGFLLELTEKERDEFLRQPTSNLVGAFEGLLVMIEK